ncbi:MAG TPA: glycosyltransferase family 4 protein [Patescibacteria group bacterium]|nr:glycosyltransferase family 4 protein [Patescibacteria group bacterium]
MKIALINNLYPPYDKGGAERIVEASARELSKQGHQVVIITTKPRSSKAKNRQESARYLSSAYYHLARIPKFLRIFWHIWDLYNWKNYLKLKKILRQENPDLVITHNLKGVSGLTPKLLRQEGLKHTHILHDIQLLHPSGLLIQGREKKLDSRAGRIYRQKQKQLWESPPLVVSPSRWLLDLHKKYGFFEHSSTRVLPNPLPTEADRCSAQSKPEPGFQFLYVGQIEKHKGVNILVQAFRELSDPSDRLKIIGQGTELKRIRSRISDPRIHFLGAKNKKEVEEFMLSSDCLVVPSLCYENSPTVIYEAVRAGLPILASNLGGIPEVAALGASRLFDPKNKKGLVAQMKKIKKNGTDLQAVAEKKRKRIQNRGSEEYIQNLLDLIENQY